MKHYLKHPRFAQTVFTGAVIVTTILGVLHVVPHKYALKIPFYSQQQMDMGKWQYYPGAVQKSDGVEITPVDYKIVNQDGTGGYPNPAVNIGGQYLSFNGNFALSFKFDANQAKQSIQLYSQPPIIYDEWRYESPSINIAITNVDNPKLSAETLNGKSQNPVTKTFDITKADKYNLKIERNGADLSLTLNDKFLGKITPPKLFETKQLWFGAQGTASWTLNSAQVSSGNNSAVFKNALSFDEPESNDQTLAKQISKQNKKIGAAVSLYPLMADDNYRNIALTQFNQWTTENELKAQFVHPSEGQYQFGPTDLLVQVANQNKIKIHGHALVFGEANPTWMQQAPKEKLQAIMTDHVSSIVSRYGNSIDEWDVINEPLSDKGEDYQNGNGLRRHIWYNAMGDNYIATALKAARDANPEAKLYINDYGLEEDGDRWEAMINLVNKLQDQEVPLSGIGFESHIYEPGDHEDKQVIMRHMKQLADMGLSVRISEIDVHGDDEQVQAQQYSAVLEACLESPNCNDYTTWGISDAYGSTTSDHTYPPEVGDDLLWDDEFQPKPAFEAIKRVIK